MNGAGKCGICGESFSVLRSSTKCDVCSRTLCSVCCHPSSVDRKRKMCLLCTREQRKKEDTNDDRPKWLREAQQANKSNNLPSFSPSTSQKPFPKRVPEKLNDDRPKWLREAQEAAQQPVDSDGNIGSSNVDLDLILEQRLGRLKIDVQQMSGRPVATDEDLHLRLARLRRQDGSKVCRAQNYSVVIPAKIATESQEIDALITQIRDRINLAEDDVDLIKQLEERLQRLKEESAKLGIKNSELEFGNSSGVGSGESMQVDEDSEEEAERLVKMLPGLAVERKEDSDSGEDFCVICVDEPEVICQDCDGDKYCRRCFGECHREWDAMEHRSRLMAHSRSKR